MALRWIEGFETFGASGTTGSTLETALQQKYDEANTTAGGDDGEIVAGRGSGLGIEWGGGAYHHSIRVDLDSQATWIIGFAVKLPSSYSNGGNWLQIIDSAGPTNQIVLDREGATLRLKRNTTVLDTYGLSTNQWVYVEVKVTIHNTTGSYVVRFNGTAVMSGSSVDTQASSNASADRLIFYGDQYALTTWDDIYVCDSTGSTNNDFLGDMKVTGIVPNGDVTGEKDFTCSTGTDHYALVDEEPPDGDTTYVESGTSGDRDLYDYENIDTGITGIKGIQINTIARVTDAQSKTLITSCKSNTTVDEDAGVSIGSTSFVGQGRIMEQDPDTSSAWTAAGINAAQFGVKVG